MDAASPLRLYVGTYTFENAIGIYRFHFDPAAGSLADAGPALESANPSFLALHPNGQYLYAVNEQGEPGGGVSALGIDPQSGALSLINEQPSHGTLPCHLSIDATGRWLFVANYGSGSLAVYPIQDGGSLGEASDVIQHEGHGPDQGRQEGPHAHAIYVTPDNRYVLACDLGIDKVMIYRLDREQGKLLPHGEAVLQPGAGPRHLDFHPNGKYVYVINELDSTLAVFAYDAEAGRLSALQTLSTLPEDYTGPKSAAEIMVHPSGRFIYASNRGQSNSIAIFAVEETSGKLALVGHVSSQGQNPRHFTIDPSGKYLLAANQDSDSIVTFALDLGTGHLSELSSTEIPWPVCLKFA